MTTPQRLRTLIEDDEITLMPGVYDGISARVVEAAGFDAGFISGSAVSNSRLGKPDVGFLDLSENAAHTRHVVDAVDIPLFADADTGYGNAVNVHHTVGILEKTGVAGVMIEDQQWPKRCGHMDGKSVIPANEMCRKVEAAVSARTDPDLVLMARTDAAATHGVDEAIDRLNAYAAAGADLLFADALLSEDDVRRVAAEVEGAVLVNMGYGVRRRPTTPLLSPREMEAYGVDVALYARLITGAAVRGMRDALQALRDSPDRSPDRPDLTLGFEEYTDLMGLPGYRDLEAAFVDD